MDNLWQTPKKNVACGLLTGIILVTAVVLSRRITGEATALASVWSAVLAGSVAMVVSILSLHAVDLSGCSESASARMLAIAVCGLPGVMLGLSLLPAGSSSGMAGLIGLYLISVVVTGVASDLDIPLSVTATLQIKREKGQSSFQESARENYPGFYVPSCPLEGEAGLRSNEGGRETPLDQLSEQEPLESDLDIESSNNTVSLFDSSESLPHPATQPETSQWMSRSTVEGYDTAEGSIRVRFVGGQRMAAVHLPFSPPLPDTPEFECEPADDSEARIRMTAVHSYGVRIEVTRTRGCDIDEVIELGWMASSPLTESAAA